MATKSKAKKKHKVSNIGLRAAKVNPLKTRFKLSKHKRLNVVSLVAISMLVGAFGGIVIYRTFAAGLTRPPTEAEIVQIKNINRVRTERGFTKVTPGACLTRVARRWSKKMATSTVVVDGKRVHLRHNPNFGKQIKEECGGQVASWAGENVALKAPCGSRPPGDRCSKEIFEALMDSKGHRQNILKHPGFPDGAKGNPNYVGVGSYLTKDGGTMYITHLFAQFAKPLKFTYQVE
jgi:uncharacterized protein YkwD